MLARLARIILALFTFPLIGAYGLRWAGGFVAQMLTTSGVKLALPLTLDLIGAGLGLILGLIFTVQIIGCCMQPEALPVRPPADNVLIILGFTLLADVALSRLLHGAQWLKWAPAVNLVIWAAAAAATSSLHRMRRQWRAPRAVAPPPPAAAPPSSPYST